MALHTVGRCTECSGIHTREAQHCADCGHPKLAHDEHGCKRGRSFRDQPYDAIAPTICYCKAWQPIA